ncbi:MAG: J domain-containing protein [Chloroflexi bacterium]|nr:J domain-containing protein [Chloroflexota bacterium]
MNDQSLQTILSSTEKTERLQVEFENAKAALFAAEAELAEEQAAVNAFRMHCRLTIGNWVETLLELRTEKQTVLTKLHLLQQEQGIDADEPVDGEAGGAGNGRFQHDDEIDPYSLADDYAANVNDRRAEKRLYRELARRFHPDLSINSMERAHRTSIMAAINVAYENRDVQILRDLAGELDPATVIDVKMGETAVIHTLQKKIASCRRRQRKVVQQLNALRRENTAKLWRQAQQISPNSAENWWQDVAQSLQREIDRLRVDIVDIQSQISLLTDDLIDDKSC